MPEPPDTGPAPRDRTRLAGIAGLGLTQIVGWGSTYNLPAVLGPSMGASLGLPSELVFGGVTLMLLVSGLAAPRAGALMSHHGPRGAMVAGSCIMGLALVVLALAEGVAAYAAAWALIGLAAPAALSQGALSAVAAIAGADPRRAISTLLLVTGLSSTVFWPLAAWLEGHLGWRGTCLAFAAIHGLVCTPLHALLLPRGAGAPTAPGETDPAPPALSAERRRRAFVLAALAFSLAGFVSWGLPLLAIEVLKSLGLPAGSAVLAASFMGPAQVLARLAEVAFGQRAGILNVGLVSTALMPFALGTLLFAGGSMTAALVFAVGYGLSAGAMTVVRSVAPLTLFGREAYTVSLGRLALPQNLAFAASPVLFAAALSRSGPDAALALALGGAILAFAAMAALARLGARPAP